MNTRILPILLAFAFCLSTCADRRKTDARKKGGKPAPTRGESVPADAETVTPDIPVDLPGAARARPRSNEVHIALLQQGARTVVILKDHIKKKWSFKGKADPTALKSLLDLIPKDGGKVQIVLMTDPKVPHRAVVSMLDLLRSKGYVRLGIRMPR